MHAAESALDASSLFSFWARRLRGRLFGNIQTRLTYRFRLRQAGTPSVVRHSIGSIMRS